MKDVILTDKNELKEVMKDILDKHGKNSERTPNDDKSESIWSKLIGKKGNDDKPVEEIVTDALEKPLKNDELIIGEIKENNLLLKKIDKKLKKLLTVKINGRNPHLSFENNMTSGGSGKDPFKRVKGMGRADQRIKDGDSSGPGLIDLLESTAAAAWVKSKFGKPTAPKVPTTDGSSLAEDVKTPTNIPKTPTGGLSKGLRIAGKVAVPLTGIVAGYDKYSSIKDDKTLNASQKTAQVGLTGGGAMAGAVAGAEGGAALGGSVGSLFGGIGAAPGALIGGALGGIGGAIAGQWGGEKLGNVASDALTDDPKKVLSGTPEGKAILGLQSSVNRIEHKVNIIANKQAMEFKGTISSRDRQKSKLGDTSGTLTPANKPKKEEEKGFFSSLGSSISDGVSHLWKSAKSITSDAWDAAKKIGGHGIDKLSSFFESGDGGPGTISSGRGDHGGVSYGTHQFSSANGSLQGYLQNSKYGKEFNGLTPGTPQFNAKWKEIADKDPKGFEADQAQYTTAKYYVPQQQKLADAGLDVSKRSKALQSAVYSASVQFGGNSDLILNALKAQNINPKTASDEDIINAIYQYKMANNDTLFKGSSLDVRQGTLTRAATEKETVLTSLKEERANPKPTAVGSNRPKMNLGTNSSPARPKMSNGSGRGQGTSIFSGVGSFFSSFKPGFMAGVDRTTTALGNAGSAIAGGVGSVYNAVKSFVGDALKPADNSVDISGIQPAVLGNLNAMASDYAKRTGQPLQINSGYRASGKQARLYQADLAANGGQPSGKVAPPGSSLHNYGMAVDINSSAGDYLQQSGMLDAYGFTRPVPGEPWHLEPKGINRTNVKLNPSAEASKVKQIAKPAATIKDIKPPQSDSNDVSKRKTENDGPVDKGFMALVAKKKPATTSSVAGSSGSSSKKPTPVVAKSAAGNVVKPTGTPGVTPVVVDNTPTDVSVSSSGAVANVCEEPKATPVSVTPSTDIRVSSQNDKLDSTAGKPQAPVVINNINNTSSQDSDKGSREFGMNDVAGPNPYTIAMMTF
jgi:hypothetical protein